MILFSAKIAARLEWESFLLARTFLLKINFVAKRLGTEGGKAARKINDKLCNLFLHGLSN